MGQQGESKKEKEKGKLRGGVTDSTVSEEGLCTLRGQLRELTGEENKGDVDSLNAPAEQVINESCARKVQVEVKGAGWEPLGAKKGRKGQARGQPSGKGKGAKKGGKFYRKGVFATQVDQDGEVAYRMATNHAWRGKSKGWSKGRGEGGSSMGSLHPATIAYQGGLLEYH